MQKTFAFCVVLADACLSYIRRTPFKWKIEVGVHIRVCDKPAGTFREAWRR